MIPNQITRSHILQAIVEIRKNGVPQRRESTKFDLLHEGMVYPPKYVISLACKYATGEKLLGDAFSGGNESNRFLKKLSFDVIPKLRRYPIESYSWTIHSDSIAVKRMDRSSFLHSGTGIPHNIKFFFHVEDLVEEQKQEATLIYRGTAYSAHFQLDAQLQRVRLFWRSDFAALVKETLPEWYAVFADEAEMQGEKDRPLLRFQRIPDRGSAYEIGFVVPEEIDRDIEAERIEEEEYRKEGAVRKYYGKRYERDPKNRRKAIELHGTVCAACGFDFEAYYGQRGKGFIEVHHTQPLSEAGEEIAIDPKTDLVPVCSNCHRMIHRRKDDVLSVEELREKIKKEGKQ
jgi:5-methylcytosine-specific restriction endonuclease McrA